MLPGSMWFYYAAWNYVILLCCLELCDFIMLSGTMLFYYAVWIHVVLLCCLDPCGFIMLAGSMWFFCWLDVGLLTFIHTDGQAKLIYIEDCRIAMFSTANSYIRKYSRKPV